MLASKSRGVSFPGGCYPYTAPNVGSNTHLGPNLLFCVFHVKALQFKDGEVNALLELMYSKPA